MSIYFLVRSKLPKMRVLFVSILLQITVSCLCENIRNECPIDPSVGSDVGDPLFLTPYIEQGFILEAKAAAKVTPELFFNTTSYSGYFTVNNTLHKNLFAWFFPSENPEDPVLLWLQGGPGLTSMYGLFAEIGPFLIQNNTIVKRNLSWTNTHSILFIDNPVGTGYSFTDEGGLAVNELQIADELYEALRQFFLLFPELRKNEFFVTGESYAGKYVPVISEAIFNNNEDLPESSRINLQGLAIGNGWLDPINQMNIGEYMYQLGLVDTSTRSTMNQYRDKSIILLHQGKFNESTAVQREISKLFKNVSGFENLYNYLIPESQNTEFIITCFVQRNDIRKAIHVGNLTFNPDKPVDTALFGDIMVSVAEILADLLEQFRVLIYSGQLDLAVPYPTTVHYLHRLKFSAAEEYITAERKIWYKNGDIAGYIKTAGNLTEVMIRNAGHIVPADKPEVAYDMINAFTRNTKITSEKKSKN